MVMQSNTIYSISKHLSPSSRRSLLSTSKSVSNMRRELNGYNMFLKKGKDIVSELDLRTPRDTLLLRNIDMRTRLVRDILENGVDKRMYKNQTKNGVQYRGDKSHQLFLKILYRCEMKLKIDLSNKSFRYGFIRSLRDNLENVINTIEYNRGMDEGILMKKTLNSGDDEDIGEMYPNAFTNNGNVNRNLLFNMILHSENSKHWRDGFRKGVTSRM